MHACVHMYISHGYLFTFFLEHKYIHLDSWGKVVLLRVENSDTIKTVKENVQDKIGISFLQQEVIFKGKILQDDSALSECDDIQYSKFEVLLKVLGKNEALT